MTTRKPVARAPQSTSKASPVKALIAELDNFAGHQKAGPRVVDKWFDDRPDIMEAVEEGIKAGYSDHLIWKWLKTEHQFPFSVAVLRGIREHRG